MIEASPLKSCSCLMCNRELTDPQSVARMIGPDCWNHLRYRRLREISGAMGHYERIGWDFTKQVLAKHGIDLESLFPAEKEPILDA